MEYKHVFTPFQFGNVTVKNRIVVPPMLACMASADGFVTPELISFYKAFAAGGAGMVIIGDAATDFVYGRGHNSQLNLGDDRATIGLYQLARTIKTYDARVSIEVNHRGRWTFPRFLNGKNPIGPSPVTAPSEEWNAAREGRVPTRVTEMDQDMIDMTIQSYVDAVGRCMTAGFDLVMIHGGHGHLIAQFASKFANRRTDNYGGSLENRARFAVELLDAIRKKYGRSVTLDFRVSAAEFVKNGMTQEETIEFLKIIEDKIDLLNVSISNVNDMNAAPYHLQPTYLPRCFTRDYAEAIHKSVRVPVTCVGSVPDLATADRLIDEGVCDLVAMGRRHVADPDIVKKSWLGLPDMVRPCLRCGTCSENPRVDLPVFCAVNPVTGRERFYEHVEKAEEPRHILIAGGGPAGLEAARRAVQKGHRVTLVEKSGRLGGTLHEAAGPDYKQDMKDYLRWTVHSAEQLPIDLRLNTACTPELVRQLAPDVLIIAVGGRPNIPDTPGADGDNVYIAGKVMEGVQTVRGENVVVIGAGLTACETALLLMRQGKKVRLVFRRDRSGMAEDAKAMNRFTITDLVTKEGVEITDNVNPVRITAEGVEVEDRRWQRQFIPCDSVVLATGTRALSDTVEALSGCVRQTYVIGDCKAPRNIHAAVHEGFDVVMEQII